MSPLSPFEQHEYDVGQPLRCFRGVGLEGSFLEQITPSGLLHVTAFCAPNPDEIREFTTGCVRARLLTAPHTLMYLTKFGEMPWQEAPYTPHRVPSEYWLEPRDVPYGYGWNAVNVLVDANTGIICKIRAGTFSTRFSTLFQAEYQQLLATAADDAMHEAEVLRFQKRSTKRLAEEATIRYAQGEEKN